MFFKGNEKLEEALYEQVAKEIGNGEINQGLWLKATVESGGSEFQAKALYTKFRVKQLKREVEEAQEYKLRVQAQHVAELRSKGIVVCPNCQSEVKPQQKAKGSILVGLLLCLVFVIPGLIYFLLMSGYKHVCPECGHTISKDLIKL